MGTYQERFTLIPLKKLGDFYITQIDTVVNNKLSFCDANAHSLIVPINCN